MQSSSASTSVIVGLVASGALEVKFAVPMVMGANIGTTVTNTLVSMGHVRQSTEFRRALAAATVHDFFNVLAVAILLPVEVFTGLITKIAERISEALVGSSGTEWKSPIKTWVKKPVGWIKDALGGLGAEDNLLGTLMVIVGLIIILAALALITQNMRKLVAERVERSLNAILGKGRWRGRTHSGDDHHDRGAVVEYHDIDSHSTLSRWRDNPAQRLSRHARRKCRHNHHRSVGGVGLGQPRSPDRRRLAHTTFNVLGIFLLYVIPVARDVPVRAAERLADVAVERRTLAVAYVVVVFIVPTVDRRNRPSVGNIRFTMFAFFRKPDASMDHIASRSVVMLNDARHSFDLASLALLGGASVESVAEDVRSTDQRINQAEQDIRSELVVHISVQGAQDIGLVMGYTLLIKKIERIGDQAKNILDLAEGGSSLADGTDAEELMAERSQVSTLFAEAGRNCSPEPDPTRIEDYAERVLTITQSVQDKIDELTQSDLPGRQAVPRAIYYRYLKRIAANLLGVVSTASETASSHRLPRRRRHRYHR